jgi:hypothetical protein
VPKEIISTMKSTKKVWIPRGKFEIDERTRLRNEYVRARIACRDVTAVPGVVESSLGLFLYDFSLKEKSIRKRTIKI